MRKSVLTVRFARMLGFGKKSASVSDPPRRKASASSTGVVERGLCAGRIPIGSRKRFSMPSGAESGVQLFPFITGPPTTPSRLYGCFPWC